MCMGGQISELSGSIEHVVRIISCCCGSADCLWTVWLTPNSTYQPFTLNYKQQFRAIKLRQWERL